MSSIHIEYESTTDPPFLSRRPLGHGASGAVDVVERVNRPGELYARKYFMLKSYFGIEKKISEAKEEARVAARLSHRHIIDVVETYRCANQFGIIMRPVGQEDLAFFLARLDAMSPGKTKTKLRLQVLSWPMCLLRAVDYMHEMRVKHRDLKPSNIIITDFGISKEALAEETTGSYGTIGAFTRAYAPPEFFPQEEDARRGRASDIFSLGCIFLEMVTILVGPSNSLERLKELIRKSTGTRIYAKSRIQVLQWIWHLWAHWSVVKAPSRNPANEHGIALAEFAFFMMDPDPRTRITACQIVALTTAQDLYYYYSIDQRANDCCVSTVRSDNRHCSLPDHAQKLRPAPTSPHLWDSYEPLHITRPWLRLSAKRDVWGCSGRFQFSLAQCNYFRRVQTSALLRLSQRSA